MNPGMVKRHFDVVLSVGTLAAGQIIEGISVQLPNDAPFVLKSRAMRMQARPASVASPGQTLLNNVSTKFTGPDEQYMQQQLVPWRLEAFDYGQTPNGLWLPTPVVYPAGGVIQADVLNSGVSSIPGLTLYFRGYQLYPCGQVGSFTYPRRMSTTPYNVVTTVSALGVTAIVPTNKLQLLTPNDWAMRTAQGVSVSAIGTSDVYPLEVSIQLYDWNFKPYSNAPVHVDILFGNYTGFPNNPASSNTPGINGYQPGLFTPEIYLPANQVMYYDLIRADAYLQTTFGLSPATESFTIGWKGAKVNGQ